jgi:hypothetical protein
MIQFFQAHWSEVTSFLTGLGSGAAITLGINSYRTNRASGSGAYAVQQSNIKAGGDVIGRDKKS